MNNNLKLIAVSAVVAVVGLGAYFLTQPSTDTTFATSVEPAATDVDTSGIADMTLGDANAPITIVEYASFTCPHCARFHDSTFKDLKRDYIDTGKAQFIYREVYFDRFGLWASIVARCGGAERFFGITDVIYAQQSVWNRGAPAEIAANLRRIGLSAGLSGDQVDACFSDAEQAETLVAWYEQNAKADDISSTPSFVINGTKHSNMSYDAFKSLLDGL